MIANILPTDPPTPDPREEVSRSNSNFSEHGHVAYQIKGNGNIGHHASIYSLLTHILNLWVGLKCKKNSECCHVAYQIKGKKYGLTYEGCPRKS